MTATEDIAPSITKTSAPARPRTALPRSLTVNYLLLTGGELAAKILGFAGFAYLGQVFGPETYGRLEFAWAIMVFFTLAADFGLGMYGAREIAKHRERAAQFLGEIATLRLILAIASFTVLALVTALLETTSDVKLLLMMYGATLFATPALLQWFFQGHDRMHWVAATSIVRQGTFTVLLFLVIRAEVPLPWVGVCECCAVVLAAAVNLSLLRGSMNFGLPRLGGGARALVSHFQNAAPIGLSELAWAFLWYFATVLLGVLVGGQELGWFGAAHRVVMALHTFVWLYFFNLLPTLARNQENLEERLGPLLKRSLVLTAWGGCGVALALTWYGEAALTLAYGSDFAGAGPLLAVLVWIIPIALLSGHYRYLLIANNRQTLECVCTAIGAVAALSLTPVLVPLHGALGAALALLAAQIISLACAFGAANRWIARVPLPPQLLIPVTTTVAAGMMFMALADQEWWLKAGAAGGALLLMLLGGVRSAARFLHQDHCLLKDRIA